MAFRTVSLILIAFLSASCDELFETDLNNTSIELLTPVDSAILDSGLVTFWWSAIEGADHYRLWVVQGTVNAPVKPIADTILKSPLFSISLSDSVDIFWWVKASNASSSIVSDTLTAHVN